MGIASHRKVYRERIEKQDGIGRDQAEDGEPRSLACFPVSDTSGEMSMISSIAVLTASMAISRRSSTCAESRMAAVTSITV
ncbi:hypothetical protein FB005_1634 [Sinorhizobium medicae]|nr:hypothetical protein FB006_1664 [Sinorhizobium medicae]TWA32591.1 hypothetical protein FB005_1634 [Sinorhizobium medicae]